MKERPILFSAPMVRAILEGRKTMTRRALKPQPHVSHDSRKREFLMWQYSKHRACGTSAGDGILRASDKWLEFCPYGQPGDRLWVRETTKQGLHLKPFYGADDAPAPFIWWYSRKVCPGIHMPRFASRILLEVVSVRVERLQEISPSDAVTEGCPFEKPDARAANTDPRRWFADLWNSINGPESWDANPWVWVVEFKRLP